MSKILLKKLAAITLVGGTLLASTTLQAKSIQTTSQTVNFFDKINHFFKPNQNDRPSQPNDFIIEETLENDEVINASNEDSAFEVNFEENLETNIEDFNNNDVIDTDFDNNNIIDIDFDNNSAIGTDFDNSSVIGTDFDNNSAIGIDFDNSSIIGTGFDNNSAIGTDFDNDNDETIEYDEDSAFELESIDKEFDNSIAFDNDLDFLVEDKVDNELENNQPKYEEIEEIILSQTQFEDKVLELVNIERERYQLAPLVMDESLRYIARLKSTDMYINRYLDHTSPTYGTPYQMMKSFGITYYEAGENIAMGQKTPEAVVKDWMNSPGHRANILNANYTKLGVGLEENGYYWTQLFILER